MDKQKEWYQWVTNGLVNGLTHTIHDGRHDDINWVRCRLRLWESFGRCMYALYNNGDYTYDEKTLIETAKKGYKQEETE